jgi:hypothetical protein
MRVSASSEALALEPWTGALFEELYVLVLARLWSPRASLHLAPWRRLTFEALEVMDGQRQKEDGVWR